MKYMLVCIAALALAGDRIEAPYRGCVLAPSGEVRQVYGVRSSFISTEAVLHGAMSITCSGLRVVAKTRDALVILDRNGDLVHSQEVGEGPAWIALNGSGEPAWAWLSEKKVALSWTGDAWTTSPVLFDGEVLGIAVRGEEWIAVQRRSDRLWLTRITRAGVSGDEPLVDRADYALPFPDGSVWLGRGTQLRLLAAGGDERVFVMPSPITSLTSINDGWIAVETESGTVAIEKTNHGVRQYRVAGAGR
jgi:hypothetical protein